MDKAPIIGARVHYVGICGECTGTVVQINKAPLYDDSDFDWEHDEGMPPQIGWKPEAEWRAIVKVDERPKLWPFGDSDRFHPKVGELEYL